MAEYRIERFPRERTGRPGVIAVLLLVFLLLIGSRAIAGWVVEYQWWKELGQIETWFAMITYGWLPVLAGALLAWGVLWMAHARGMRFAGERLRDHRTYARLATLALALVALILAAATIDGWTIVRYLGSRSLPAAADLWRDPVFGRPLSFYLFSLPFYSLIRSYILAVTLAAMVLYWAAARGWQLRTELPRWRDANEIDVSVLSLRGGLESTFLRTAAAIALIAFAVRFYLGRFEMVWNDHGFMVGIDYVDSNVGLPLNWLLIAATVAAAVLVWFGRWVIAAGAVAVALLIQAVVPQLVGRLYVRPNEISLERPFIEEHIRATRSAFGLENRVREVEFNARQDAPINVAEHQNLLQNVRLWDWRAFHDTITQIQALRPYYRFNDSDVDRYMLDGQLRQVLLSPRELDIAQLPDARTRWINPHFIYTHGYGMVLAEVANITSDGLPVLLVRDAPPDVTTKSLQLTRPELYYGEVTHEPVFVHTNQPEFSYPSGSDNVFTKYDGRGGFPISSLPMRVAAAIREGDANILLTEQLTPQSRMMIRRDVAERVRAVGGFLEWDPDPYLVITDSGRLVWTVDAYTVSQAHPYSPNVQVAGIGAVNYIRNSVKATVDAYDGTTTFYVFDESDPIIVAYRTIFPRLFKPESEMPADIRAHTRYPETMFRIQAEIYRTFHMLDPQAFYNKEDVWDLARQTSGQAGAAQPVTPTYIVASLPKEDRAEFLLMTSFTPRAKDNLIGVMLARCDGEKLGEIIVLQLSKQELIFGPMQIAARINQDQLIAKDLNLWNQQGSQVLRGQTLVLPVADTFLYVEPIYIQATEARMPQLKKVVLAVGNRLIYEDTYDQALARLSQGAPAAKPGLTPETDTTAQQQQSPQGAPTPPPAASGGDPRIDRVRQHLRRYRELVSQGRWAEAGRELEALESEVR
jgi:uncharacterized membrane protein (UPF0182 family)